MTDRTTRRALLFNAALAAGTAERAAEAYRTEAYAVYAARRDGLGLTPSTDAATVTGWTEYDRTASAFGTLHAAVASAERLARTAAAALDADADRHGVEWLAGLLVSATTDAGEEPEGEARAVGAAEVARDAADALGCACRVLAGLH